MIRTRRKPRAAVKPQPMTPAQVADLIARVRANTSPSSLAAGRASGARWDRYRAERRWDSTERRWREGDR